MEHCKACETKSEWHHCPVCKMTGPEIAEARRKAKNAKD